MKKRILKSFCFLSLVALGASAAYGFTAAGGGVLGSKHDINAYIDTNGVGVKDAQGRLCAYCHTPHHSWQASDAGSGDYMPLWSHEMTTKTYTEYNSPTFDGNIVDPLYGPSRLCMSCHDGVIAIDTHYTRTAGQGAKVLTGDDFGQYGVGTGATAATGDLSNDHPVGFIYADSVDAVKGIKPDTTTFIGNAKNIKISDALYQGYMTCATCHDVHNKDNTNGTGSANYFVYAEQKDSALCRTCHDK